MTLQPSNYRPDIDGLRAIAVIAVIIFHAFPNLASGGFAGVDVFFVISGYLISRIIFSGLQGEQFSFRKFYLHRIHRIFPALITLLLGCLVLGWFVMLPGEYQNLGLDISASSFFVENLKLWRDVGYFDTAAELKPLLHLWSLSVEEQFYLFYPLFVWIAWKLRFNLFIVILLSAALSLAVNIENHSENPDYVFYLLHARFWELLAGGLIAYQTLFKPAWFFNARYGTANTITGNFLATIALFLVFSAIAGIYNDSSKTSLMVVIVAVTGACLLVANNNSWVHKYILSNQLMVYIGLISYPLYLWHWSLLSFLRLHQHDHNPSSLHKLAAIALSVVLAWMTYQFIEKPFRYGKNSNAKTIILVCFLLLVGVLGIYILKNDNLPSRFPKQVRAMAAYKHDQTPFIKYYACRFYPEGNTSPFTPACLGSLASSQHGVMVWGDSHASMIYPAIDELFGGHGDVARFEQSACPPIIGASCLLDNQIVLDVIRQYVPETVVLFAYWGRYSNRWNSEAVMARQLLNTIHTLQSYGVKKILLLGPAPIWVGSLPELVLEEMLSDAPSYRAPQRMNHNLDPVTAVADTDLKLLLAGEKGVQYFSTRNVLCNSEGCLVRTSDDPASLTSWDYGHFTQYGAVYIAKQLPFKNLK